MDFRILSMQCDGCLRGVAGAIRSVDPVAEATADIPARMVTGVSTLPRDAFLVALSDRGFPAN